MDRNTIIAFVLIGAILVVWLFINTPEKSEQTRKEQDTTSIVEKIEEESPKTVVEEKIITPDTELKEENNQGMFSTAVMDEGRIITIETDLAIYELSTKGGNFHKVFLKKFNNWYSADVNGEENFYKTSVQLVNNSIGNAYNISFISNEGKAINTGLS